jgi:RNase P/RNase MRP subunit p29
MKWLTGITLAAAIALGASLPALAESTASAIPTGKQITGQVSDIDGSTMTVKTAAGETQTFQVNRAVISSLKLENGSNVVIDGTRLQTGRVVHIDPYTAEVTLDQGGELKTYMLTREARRYLVVGDRVVITPDLRLVRTDLYKLTANDLRVQSAVVASAVSTSSSASASRVVIQQEANTGGASVPVAPEPAPPISEVSPAVNGLW